jgi:conjugal transfer pilus assembly protein TraF
MRYFRDFFFWSGKLSLKAEFGLKVTRTLGNQRILIFFSKPKIYEMRSILSKVENSAYKSIAPPHISYRFLALQSVVIPNSVLMAEKRRNSKFLPLALKIFVYFMGTLFVSLAQAKPFYTRHEEGWFWYQRDEKKEMREDSLKGKEHPVTSSSPSQKVLSAGGKVKQIQQDFEEATARAILSPTLANVQDVMTLQRQIIDRSSAFQEKWMQASLFEGQHLRPEDNGAPLHRKIMQEQREQELQKKIRRLAQETGLFFIFRKDCKFCHAFAPVVKEFAAEYGFDVKAISGDGGKLEEFLDAVPDNGMIQKINVKRIYPALFLAHPLTGSVIPVAWGMTTPAQLLDNFSTIIKTLEGKTSHAR